jgi:hypothetical protein
MGFPPSLGKIDPEMLGEALDVRLLEDPLIGDPQFRLLDQSHAQGLPLPAARHTQDTRVTANMWQQQPLSVFAVVLQ